MRAKEIQQLIISLINSVSKNDTVQLSPGQVISVMIKEIQGNMALLNYQGRDIMARVEADITAGQRLKCLVEGERQGQLFLKVLDGTKGNITSQALKDILLKMGLSQDKTNLRLVGEMIRQEMPLNAESVKTLSLFMRSNQIVSNEAWLPVFLLNRNIPLTSQMLQETKGLLTDIRYLQFAMDTLRNHIEKLNLSARPGSELRNITENLLKQLDSFRLSNLEGQDNIATKLWNVYRQLTTEGSTHPNQIPARVAQLTIPAGQAIIQSSQPSLQSAKISNTSIQTSNLTSQPADPIQITAKTDLPLTFDRLNLTAKQSEPDFTMPIRARSVNTEPDKTLKNLVQRLSVLADRTGQEDIVKEKFISRINSVIEEAVPKAQQQEPKLASLLERLSDILSENRDSQQKELLQLIKNVAGKLEFVQNFNHRMEAGRENTVIIYSTLVFDQKEEPLRLSIHYKESGSEKKHDFSSCRVEVKLHSESLGLVKCELQVNDRNLIVQFISDNPTAAGIIDKNKEILATRLDKMNYHVKMMPCLVQSESGGLLPDGEVEMPGLFKVNLRI